MDNTQAFLERCNALMMGQSPVLILRTAYDKIRDPERWAVGAQALDSEGKKVRPDDPTAARWDVQGAIAIACNPYGILPPWFMVYLDGLAQEEGATDVGQYNDHFRHEMVLELLTKAIGRLEANGYT